jgi:hypothetical protein
VIGAEGAVPELASVTDVDGQGRQGQEQQDTVRCFKCPRERGKDEPGWYFLDPSKLRGSLRRHIVFVCPAHYEQFAVGERARWDSACEPVFPSDLPPLTAVATSVDAPTASAPLPLAPADPRDSAPPTFVGEMMLPTPIVAAT